MDPVTKKPVFGAGANAVRYDLGAPADVFGRYLPPDSPQFRPAAPAQADPTPAPAVAATPAPAAPAPTDNAPTAPPPPPSFSQPEVTDEINTEFQKEQTDAPSRAQTLYSSTDYTGTDSQTLIRSHENTPKRKRTLFS